MCVYILYTHTYNSFVTWDAFPHSERSLPGKLSGLFRISRK